MMVPMLAWFCRKSSIRSTNSTTRYSPIKTGNTKASILVKVPRTYMVKIFIITVFRSRLRASQGLHLGSQSGAVGALIKRAHNHDPNSSAAFIIPGPGTGTLKDKSEFTWHAFDGEEVVRYGQKTVVFPCLLRYTEPLL